MAPTWPRRHGQEEASFRALCAASGVCRYWAAGRGCRDHDLSVPTSQRRCLLHHPRYVDLHDVPYELQCHRFARGSCARGDCRRVHRTMEELLGELPLPESHYDTATGEMSFYETTTGTARPSEPTDVAEEPQRSSWGSSRPVYEFVPDMPDMNAWLHALRGDICRSNAQMDWDLAAERVRALRDHFDANQTVFFGPQLSTWAADIYDALDSEYNMLMLGTSSASNRS